MYVYVYVYVYSEGPIAKVGGDGKSWNTAYWQLGYASQDTSMQVQASRWQREIPLGESMREQRFLDPFGSTEVKDKKLLFLVRGFKLTNLEIGQKG